MDRLPSVYPLCLQLFHQMIMQQAYKVLTQWYKNVKKKKHKVGLIDLSNIAVNFEI